MMIIKDDFSRYTWLYGLKTKSSAATAFAFRKFLADVQADGTENNQVEIVWSDNGTEFTGRGGLARLCNELTIKQEFTPPYTPQ